MTPAARTILTSVAEKYRIRFEDILGPRRKVLFVRARIECAVLMRGLGYTTPKIGRVLNRDHTSVLHYFAVAEKRLAEKLPWRAPRVKHTNCNCAKCTIVTGKPAGDPIRQVLRIRSAGGPLYKLPYAGADPREYQWRRRARVTPELEAMLVRNTPGVGQEDSFSPE
jgi:Bacterial dnaA protein helix-turn-helix